MCDIFLNIRMKSNIRITLSFKKYLQYFFPALEYPGGRRHLLEADGAVKVLVEDGREVGVRGRGGGRLFVGGCCHRSAFRWRVRRIFLKEEWSKIDSLCDWLLQASTMTIGYCDTVRKWQKRQHRSPGGNQPQKMTPDERLRLSGRDMSGEPTRSDSDSIALRTIYAIFSKTGWVTIRMSLCFELSQIWDHFSHTNAPHLSSKSGLRFALTQSIATFFLVTRFYSILDSASSVRWR